MRSRVACGGGRDRHGCGARVERRDSVESRGYFLSNSRVDFARGPDCLLSPTVCISVAGGRETIARHTEVRHEKLLHRQRAPPTTGD